MSIQEGKSIQIVKSGSVLKVYPCVDYSIVMFSGLVVIQEKITKEVALVLSQSYYDYIELCED